MNTKSKSALFASVGLLSILAMAHAEEKASVSAADALAKLKEGNDRYVSSNVSAGKPTAEKRAANAGKQHPFAIIVGCADSRTSPEIVFDQNIGDLFVVRTAGNLAGEHALGSIEYAVEHLGSRLVVVLGHERCGAVESALPPKPDDHKEHKPSPAKFVKSLLDDIQPAVAATANKLGDRWMLSVEENARQVAAKIGNEAGFGDLAEEVRIVSAVYDLDTGKVAWGTAVKIKAAKDAAPPLAGKYLAEQVSNDWHYAEITVDDEGLKWSNKADVSWRLNIKINGAQPGKSWIVIGEGAPEGYKGKELEVIHNDSGAVVKLIGKDGGVWNKKDW